MSRRLVASLVAATVVGSGAVVLAQPTSTAAPAPSGLTPADGEAGGDPVVLAWDRPTGAAKFEVQVSTDPTFAGTPLWKTTTVNDRVAPSVQLPAGEVWWRVGDATSAAPTEWATTSFLNDTTEAPDLVRPVAGAVIQPPEDPPRFNWQPVDGALSYTIEISRDDLFVDPAQILTDTFTTTAVVITTYQAPGRYFWRVRANLTGGVATPWSTVRDYEVEGLPLPELPVAPALAPDWQENPTEFPVVEDVVLDWEPVKGAVAYQLQVSTDHNFLSVVHKHDRILGTRYSPPATLDNDEYYWRIRPIDAAGNRPDWPTYGAPGEPLGPWRFQRVWDDQPTLVHPAPGSTVGDPLFYEWTAVERASRYEVVLLDAATGEEECTTRTVHTTVMDPSCVPDAPGTYRWAVLGIDEGGSAAPETEIVNLPAAEFTYAPEAPTTTGGPFDVDMVAGHTASLTGTSAAVTPDPTCPGVVGTCLPQTPVLTWDPVPGATSYRFTLAYDAALTNRVTGYNGVGVQDPMFTFTKTLPDSQAGKPYYWVVQPCGTTCAPLEPAKVSFAKRSRPVTLTAPANGAEVRDDVTLDWASELEQLRTAVPPGAPTPTSAALTEPKSYVVQVSTTPAFGSRDVIETETVDQTTFTSFAETYPEGTLYWRVSAVDSSGNPTVWSDTWSFVKRSPVPTLTEPADGAEIAGDLTLAWEALEFAEEYEVEITPAGGGTPKYHTTVHTSWAPEDPFPVSSEAYAWRVRRVDAGNRKGDWSEQRVFRMGGVVPALTLPAPDAADVAPNSSLFTWLPDPRASKYRWELRRAGSSSTTKTVTTPNPAWAPVDVIPGGTWEWRVSAFDAKNTTTPLGTSAWRSFTVDDGTGIAVDVEISGSGKVGTDLAATAPVFVPAADQVTYSWYRGTSRISGQTGATYTVTTSDVGQALTVRATGKRAGYQDATSTSNAITGQPGDPVVAFTRVTMRGTPAVGNTLEALPGTWEEGARVSYQWYRNGAAIERADDETYTLTAADAGRRVHVVERATLAGRQPGQAAATAVVVRKLRSATTLTPSTTRPTTKQRVTATARVRVSGISSPGGTVTFYDGSRRLGRATLRGSTAALRLPLLRAGRHTLKAVYSGGVQALGSSRSVRVTVTRPRR